MPTYEYACPEGHEFELFQKMSEKPRAKCPVCGKMAIRKISGGVGLVFKGSGFYITDYGKDGKKSQAAVPGKGGDSAKPAGDASPSKSESGADKSSPPSTGEAGSPSAASDSKTAAAPAKKPKTTE